MVTADSCDNALQVAHSSPTVPQPRLDSMRHNPTIISTGP